MCKESPNPAEVVLVIDDEPFVLNTVCRVLERAGFTVLRAESPLEALLVAAQYRETIHLMVCDVVLPCLSGPTLAERLTDLHPETRCLFIAGMPDNPEVTDHVLSRGSAFLPKPFVPAALLEKVQETLSASRRMAMSG